MVQEVDHQHEVEALGLGDELGCVDAAERVAVVAAPPLRVLDIGAVELDAEVPPVGERGVLADPAADVEDARLAVQQAPAAQQRPASPVEAETEVERGPAGLPDERTVEDAHSR